MLAYFLNLSGWLLLPFMDGIAKYLSTELHFLQVVWGRYFFMLVISACEAGQPTPVSKTLIYLHLHFQLIFRKYRAFSSLELPRYNSF